MKKLFSLIAVVLTAMTMFAADVEFGSADFNGQGVSGTGGTVTATKNGVTFTCDMAYGDQYGVRCYKNSVVTISADQQIGKIVFEFATVSGKYYNGDLAEEIAVDATEWTNTMTNQARMNKISIYFGNSGDVVGEVYDTLNVAAAIEAAAALADNAQSERKVYVEGFAVDVQAYSPTYNNQIFFMADDAANTGAQVFEAYAAAPEKDGQVYPVVAGDQVRAFGYLKKYVKNGETTLEIVNPAVEFIVEAEGDRTIPEIQYDTITVAQAVEIANALEEPAAAGSSTTDPNTYVVAGFAVSVYDKNSDGSWSFYMADEAGVKGAFMASSTTTDADVEKDDFMYVTGKIAKFKSSKGNIILQIYKGTGEHGEGPAPAELDTISAAEAKTRCEALPVDGTEKVAVLCLIASIKTAYDADHGNITVWLNDDPASTYGDIQAYRAKCSEEVGVALAPHDKVLVVGNLSHTTYEKDGETRHSYQIAAGAELTLVEKAQGIENILLTEKVQKVIMDGVVYIVRDGKLFNLQGVQVR